MAHDSRTRTALPSDVDDTMSAFDRFATRCGAWASRAWFFVAYLLVVVIWASTLAVLDLNTWQLTINTARASTGPTVSGRIIGAGYPRRARRNGPNPPARGRPTDAAYPLKATPYSGGQVLVTKAFDASGPGPPVTAPRR